jgi:PIN domain nuclease of toxin-antitoxin system
LDATALLAAMLQERGAQHVQDRLVDARIGAVNLSEVVAKLQERGVPDDVVEESLAELNLIIVPFDAEQAVMAGKLRRDTRAAGLSLGDRACLALAVMLGAIAITTDSAWRNLTLPVEIELAR